MPIRFAPPEWRDVLPSTNSELAARVRGGEDLPSGFVLAARRQTAGRGRYDRRWLSAPGRDLTFSFLLQAEVRLPKVLSLPMAAAMGVAALLEEIGLRVQTKWPNDLLVDGRKICGVLAERAGDGLVVGIGLNVNMGAEEAQQVGRPATSLRLESGRGWEVEEVLERLLPHLAEWVDRWEAGGFAALRPAWSERCAQLGQRIQVGEGGRSGVLLGFGAAGQLLLEREDGTREEVWVGDLKG